MNKLETQIQKLREYGLSDNKIYALIILAQEEFFDEMQAELMDADDQELSTLAEELSQVDIQNIDKEKGSELLESSLKRIYGMSVESKIQTFVANYLENCVLEAEEVKDFLIKYQQGDPETLQKVIDAQNDPDFKDMEEALKVAEDI
jgi:hypothetical protein